jgi:hypothetical protein
VGGDRAEDLGHHGPDQIVAGAEVVRDDAFAHPGPPCHFGHRRLLVADFGEGVDGTADELGPSDRLGERG